MHTIHETPKSIMYLLGCGLLPQLCLSLSGPWPTVGNPAAIASGGVIDRRLLPHMSMQEMYNLFTENCQTHKPCSKDCFVKLYKREWKSVLGIRQVAQHARCSTCAQLCKAMKDATGTPATCAAAKL